MSVPNLKKSQNFLTDLDLVNKLLDKTNIGFYDLVYDIGAGNGLISEALVKRCRKVISVEYDDYLFKVLTEKFGGNSRIDVLKKDILKLNFPQEKYKIFSNIPFNLTSAIVNKVLLSKTPPTDCYLIMQKEAAERFLGINEGFMLNLLLAPLYDIKIIHEFNKRDFRPAPSVDSVLLGFEQLADPFISQSDYADYRKFIIYSLFQQKPNIRQRLHGIFTINQLQRLAKDLKFDLDSPATSLSFNQWLDLYRYYKVGVSPEKKRLVEKTEEIYLNQRQQQKKNFRSKIRRHS